MKRRRTLLCVIDVPNIHAVAFDAMYTQPKWGSLRYWLERDERFCEADGYHPRVETKAFLNLPVTATPSVMDLRQRQIEEFERLGFEVFAVPQHEAGDDIDYLLRVIIREYRSLPELVRVVICSHDMNNLRDTVFELEVSGMSCSLVGIPSWMGWRRDFMTGTPHELIDARSIPGFLYPKHSPQ